MIKNIKNKSLFFTDDPKNISKSKIVMICIGTPIDEYLNPKTQIFLDSIIEIKQYFKI